MIQRIIFRPYSPSLANKRYDRTNTYVFVLRLAIPGQSLAASTGR